MSKIGEELEKRLDENKYELYEACKATDKYFETTYPENIELKYLACGLVEKVIAKVEGVK